MKRAILIDGNNLVFRSYYATAYSGTILKNSKGVSTNAVLGFVKMINKIINEEKPEFIMVAFDKGKSFRHEKYKDYKAGRSKTPPELLEQFPICKEILEYMGITSIEIDNFEADDIIGTFAKMADIDKMYDATIISSDKDLLQLISHDVDVKLLKQKDYEIMNEETFQEKYGIEPIKIIDLKALMGDASDNIPGVKGIGEKTALKLIKEYNSLENLYNNIDNIKGKTKEKLISSKEDAFFSKELATIYKDINFNITFEDLKRKEINEEKLIKKYKELELFSLLKTVEKDTIISDINYIKVKDINEIKLENEYAYYLEVNKENYHHAEIIGMSFTDSKNTYYLDKEIIKNLKELPKGKKYTYDYKKSYCVFKNNNILFDNVIFDYYIGSFLLEKNSKDDISYIAGVNGYNILSYKELLKSDDLEKNISLKSKFIYEKSKDLIKELEENNMLDLYKKIEHPLIEVLAKMELNGIKVSVDKLKEMSEELAIKIELISKTIYNYAGETFNISSPKQLGEILFGKMSLPYKARKKDSYSTSHDVLVNLTNKHPIISYILEYRELTKLKSTYLDSLASYIKEDGKIHTIFKQLGARTGRLSSVDPNLQNIPVRTTEGRKIRKAFIPEFDYILTSDYSQIELRVLAHMSDCTDMINAFNNSEDIHNKVASDIFSVPVEAVTKNMRRSAKAVIFGIVYGISSWGLGENLSISPKEAKEYIDKYLDLYPGVKKYMDNIVEETKEKGYTKTLFNRKRTIDEINNPNYMIRMQGERMALNSPVQGTSADIMKMAMIKMDEELVKNNMKTKMIIQVHDEMVFDVPKEELEKLQKLVKNVMENVCKLKVNLKAEVDQGKNWYEAK